ncbi:MAG: glucosaminidase domain-containing protein [Patescibacteria group bacterium]|nr:glucosaminidase domain-containing protein [Patescibacteria group bacterium]
MTVQSFINTIGTAAKQSMRQTGLSAAFVIAEAALESGWGGSELAQRGKNLFGVKAFPGWEGATMSLPTREFFKGRWVTVNAQWCVYVDWIDSILAHAKFLFGEPRYKPALTVREDVKKFAPAIQAAGYATDPEYAKKILMIVDAHGLDSWDVPQDQWNLLDWAKEN